MNLIINKYKYGKIKDVNILKQVLLELIDIKFSPLQTLKANMDSLFDLIEAFCKRKWKEVEGSKKARLTREITKINTQRKFWQKITKREHFVNKYYNYILSLERLEPLRGFGFANTFGDSLQGNSEISRSTYAKV